MGTAFTNGRVFIGNGQVLDHATVYTKDNIIVEISDSDAGLPDDTRRIPIGDNTLFPGFIDCHVHMVMDGSADPMTTLTRQSSVLTTLKAAENARKTLEAGVTTVRDLGGKDGIDLELKKAIDQGVIVGPRILASGKLICMTGGHGWPIGREADGAEEVRKAAREQIRAGADCVKLMATGGVLTAAVEPGSAQLTREEMTAGVEEAHKAGKKTATHAMGSQGILDALYAGIDSIEHGIYLTDEIISFMKENGVFYVPTIAAMHHIAEQGIRGGIPQFAVDKNDIVAPHHRASFRKAIEAGVLIGMGTDAGTPFNFHGSNLLEITLLVRHGMSPMDAMLAATGNAAKLLGLEKSIGTVESGKVADLVLVKGNPLDEANVFSNPDGVESVMKDGVVVVPRNGGK